MRFGIPPQMIRQLPEFRHAKEDARNDEKRRCLRLVDDMLRLPDHEADTIRALGAVRDAINQDHQRLGRWR